MPENVELTRHTVLNLREGDGKRSVRGRGLTFITEETRENVAEIGERQCPEWENLRHPNGRLVLWPGLRADR
jgi:hypothetical protein